MFSDILNEYNWDEVKASIYAKTSTDVELALHKTKRDIEDFKALISPAAAPYLEQMAQVSHKVTQKRFGKTVQMYEPLYLSNECHNVCTYCGFSLENKIKRRTLTGSEILEEAGAIKQMGFDHVLLVTGESAQHVGMDYFKKALSIITPLFAHISIEVQPLDQEEYAELKACGVNSVLVYQETYHQENYRLYHHKGRKTNFEYRVNTPDRAGAAGLYKIGIGALLGLEDWRTDSFFTALHLSYLEKNYWQTKYAVSFPRLRPNAGTFASKVNISDKELLQLICAYRLFDEEVELSISTRESSKFRNNVIKMGITSISAGSKTNPGGYVVEPKSLEQFAVNDERSAKEVAEMITQQGYEPVWKDWDMALISLQNKRLV